MKMRQVFFVAIGCSACIGGPEREPESLEEWVVATDPVLMIGEVDAVGGEELFGVIGATRLSDGRIAIVNAGSSEIRYFSDQGSYLGAVGGLGDGPTEFRRIRSVFATEGDSIFVLTGDPALAVVSPSPAVVAKSRADLGSLSTQLRLGCRIDEGPRVLSDGMLLIKAEDNWGASGCPPMVEGPARTTDLVARYDPVTTRLDTLAILPGTERNGPRFASFGHTLAVAHSSDRIYAGESSGDSIAVFSIAGARQDTWHIPMEARPTRNSGQPGIPDAYPRFGRLLADRAGHLWVMAYPELEEPIGSYRLASISSPVVAPEGAEWLVLNENGTPVASVRTPAGLFVFEIGSDYVLGVARDEFDVESVRLHELTR